MNIKTGWTILAALLCAVAFSFCSRGQPVSAANTWTWDNMSESQKNAISVSDFGTLTSIGDSGHDANGNVNLIYGANTIGMTGTSFRVRIGADQFAKGDVLRIPVLHITYCWDDGYTAPATSSGVSDVTGSISPVIKGVSTAAHMSSDGVFTVPLNDSNYDPTRAYDVTIALNGKTGSWWVSYAANGYYSGMNVSPRMTQEKVQFGNKTYVVDIKNAPGVASTDTLSFLYTNDSSRVSLLPNLDFGIVNTGGIDRLSLNLTGYYTDTDGSRDAVKSLQQGESYALSTEYTGSMGFTAGSNVLTANVMYLQHSASKYQNLLNWGLKDTTNGNLLTVANNRGGYTLINYGTDGTWNLPIMRATTVIPESVSSMSQADRAKWAKQNLPLNTFATIQTSTGFIVLQNLDLKNDVDKLDNYFYFKSLDDAKTTLQLQYYSFTDAQIDALIKTLVPMTMDDGTVRYRIPGSMSLGEILVNDLNWNDTSVEHPFAIDATDSQGKVISSDGTSTALTPNTVTGEHAVKISYINAKTGEVLHNVTLLGWQDGLDANGSKTPTKDDPDGDGTVAVPAYNVDGYQVSKTLSSTQMATNKSLSGKLVAPGDDVTIGSSDQEIVVALVPKPGSIAVTYHDADGGVINHDNISGTTGDQGQYSWKPTDSTYSFVAADVLGTGLNANSSGLGYTIDTGDDSNGSTQQVSVLVSDYNYVVTHYPRAGSHARASVGLVGLVAMLLGGFGVNFKRKHS